MAPFEHDQHIPVEDLSAYADGAYLSASERAAIEQHLASCERCREELESVQAVSALLSDLPEPELPRSFRLSPEDVEPAPADPVPFQPWIVRHQSLFRYAGLAAALLLAVIVTIDLLPGETDDTEETVTMMDEPAADVTDDPEEAADSPGTMGVEEDEEVAVPESAPEMEQDAVEDEAAEAPQEEAAPEMTDEPVDEEAAPEMADEPVDEEAAPESAPDMDQDAAEHDDPVTEPAPEDGEDSAVAPTPDPHEEDFTARLAAEDEDDGLSTLQLVAIGLAGLSIALLLLGFVVPRWWSPGAQ